ncbi:MAG: hypothetical protein AB1515_02105 [Nitrospirota bacterium]
MVWLVLFFFQVAWRAAHAASASSSPPVQADVGVSYGAESNVFLSERNRHGDSFIKLNGTLSAVLQPTRTSFLLVLFDGSHQRFLQLGQADRTFANLAAHYRYALRPSLVVGVSNTLSFVDLILLDTEGDALPQGQFRALGDKIRLYGVATPMRPLQLEGGVFYRRFDMDDFSDDPSLDFAQTGADVSVKHRMTPAWTAEAGYEYSHFSYDERKARTRDSSFTGVVDPNTPDLRLDRHEASSVVRYSGPPGFEASLKAKLLANRDRFQNDLSYWQGEVRASARIGAQARGELLLQAGYKHRVYDERSREINSPDKLREAFYTGEAEWTQQIWKMLHASLHYQLITKQSNAPLRGYVNHVGLVGARAIW